MGYHVQIEKSNLTIKAQVQEEILNIWKELNLSKHNHLKNGGNSDKKWYSFMSDDYDKTCTNIDDILEELRFDIKRMPNNDVKIIDFESKMGQESMFFRAISHLIEHGQYISWKGEDDASFFWSFDGEKLLNCDPERLNSPPKSLTSQVKKYKKYNL